MNTTAYIVHTPYSRLGQMIKEYGAIFSPIKDGVGTFIIPSGWVDILDLAVKDAATWQTIRSSTGGMGA